MVSDTGDAGDGAVGAVEDEHVVGVGVAQPLCGVARAASVVSKTPTTLRERIVGSGWEADTTCRCGARRRASSAIGPRGSAGTCDSMRTEYPVTGDANHPVDRRRRDVRRRYRRDDPSVPRVPSGSVVGSCQTIVQAGAQLLGFVLPPRASAPSLHGDADADRRRTHDSGQTQPLPPAHGPYATPP